MLIFLLDKTVMQSASSTKDCGTNVLLKLGTIKHSVLPIIVTDSIASDPPSATCIEPRELSKTVGNPRGGEGETRTLAPQSNWIRGLSCISEVEDTIGLVEVVGTTGEGNEEPQ